MLCHGPQQPRFVFFFFVLCCCAVHWDYMGLCEFLSSSQFHVSMVVKSKSIYNKYKYHEKPNQIVQFDLNVSILHWMNMINFANDSTTSATTSKRRSETKQNTKKLKRDEVWKINSSPNSRSHREWHTDGRFLIDCFAKIHNIEKFENRENERIGKKLWESRWFL